jgi:hypothetical protein
MRRASSIVDQARAYVSDRANWLFIAIAVLILVAHLVSFFATMVISPLGFDEAFNLQAPLNLVQGNGYATEDFEFGRDRIAFDAIVSTGPIVELPIAISFVVFGISVESARIVMLPFLLLLIGSLFIVGRRFGGRWGGLAAVAMVLALNTRFDWPQTVIYGSSDALGEFAAAAFIALAFVLLPRHPMLAGLAVGLGALAKFITFMVAPAFVIAMLLAPVMAGGAVSLRRRWRHVLGFAGLVVAPSIGWELVKAASLREDYFAALYRYGGFLFRSGSGADGGFGDYFLERASRLFATWHLPTLLVMVLSVALFGFALVRIRRYVSAIDFGADWRPGSRRRVLARAARAIPVELWAAAGTLAVFALWWSLIASSVFVRHTMPGLLAAVPLIVALAVGGATWVLRDRSGWWSHAGRVFLVGLAITVTVQASLTVANSFRSEEWTRAQQIGAATFVRELDVDQVQGIGWWAAPEIRFLSQVPSTPVGTGDGPLILEPITRTLVPSVFDAALALCVDVLYIKDGFVICTLAADQQKLAPTFGESR